MFFMLFCRKSSKSRPPSDPLHPTDPEAFAQQENFSDNSSPDNDSRVPRHARQGSTYLTRDEFVQRQGKFEPALSTPEATESSMQKDTYNSEPKYHDIEKRVTISDEPPEVFPVENSTSDTTVYEVSNPEVDVRLPSNRPRSRSALGGLKPSSPEVRQMLQKACESPEAFRGKPLIVTFFYFRFFFISVSCMQEPPSKREAETIIKESSLGRYSFLILRLIACPLENSNFRAEGHILQSIAAYCTCSQC